MCGPDRTGTTVACSFRWVALQTDPPSNKISSVPRPANHIRGNNQPPLPSLDNAARQAKQGNNAPVSGN